ncbi:Transcriptional regulatory protein OmpR [Ruegeria sp. THAF57]|uniref:response regulator n=1 Tax=Ruegeria sp. THAF57 TaxID=2744555 RepID=UPI0015DF83FD|nr:response regulator [Ruegeria sp. THAF57]CAD0186979.1 Transcriptional regulatory protein OmpR [Ruegeria sp. THAF57]
MSDVADELGGMNERILICDDDVEFAENICEFLLGKGYQVDHVPNVPTAREKIEAETYDLFLLDLIMPGTTGKVLCREIAARLDAGIIMISSVDDDAERISLLELGADDYIIKPFNDLELLARIRAVMRRRQSGQQGQKRLNRFGPWELVENERHLKHDDGRMITLTSSEARVMRFFVENPDVLCTREDLLAVARTRQHGGAGDRSVDALIKRLRSKIEADPANPDHIRTVWGQGYIFRPS